MTVRSLDSAQTTAFDTEYVNPERWSSLRHSLTSLFVNHSLNALDIGGGNGVFADRLLELPFIRKVTVLEREGTLLQRNRAHERKQLVHSSFEEFRPDERYDLIVLNWVLHHLVGDTYADSRANIAAGLQAAQRLLTPQGTILVYENMYDDWFNQNVSSFLIYQATSSKLLAPITRRLGANTAGVGVCFNSEKGWRSIFSKAGLDVVRDGHDSGYWKVSIARQAAFLLRSVRCGYFLLRSTAAAP
jgi:SAM-dependent methyltransferase